MTPEGSSPQPGQSHATLRLALLGVIGQVGCLTLVIVMASLGAGLWLDSRCGSRPLFTLLFVLASVPVTLYLMVRIVLSLAPRLQVLGQTGPGAARKQEGSEVGQPTDDGS